MRQVYRLRRSNFGRLGCWSFGALGTEHEVWEAICWEKAVKELARVNPGVV